jgi:hypothetical protein
METRYAQILSPPIANAGVMISATSLHLPEIRTMCSSFKQQGISMTLDCGMIQGTITENEYIELLCLYEGYFDWFASVDVPGSLGLSSGNYNYLRDYLPEDLYDRLLYVLQGSPKEGFTRAQYCTLVQVLTYATPFLGIGGLAPYCRRGQFALVERYLDMIYAALGREVCQYIHLFGVGNYRLLHKYRHKFGSADSSSWLCAVHGEQLQRQGGRYRCQRPFDKSQLLRANAETIVDWAAEDAFQLPLFADGSPSARPPCPPSRDVSPYLLDIIDI